jgi:hypothetical protein
MNDAELDRLLDTWKAPAPKSSLRAGLRDRFPRAERRQFHRPLRWVLAIALASAAVAVGMQQSGGDASNFRLARLVDHVYHGFIDGIEALQATAMMHRIQQSEPRLYMDGQPGAPLEYGHAGTLTLRVPGSGVYSVSAYPRRLPGWEEVGGIHGSAIEFQLAGTQVRIECNRVIAEPDRPVFARRWE